MIENRIVFWGNLPEDFSNNTFLKEVAEIKNFAKANPLEIDLTKINRIHINILGVILDLYQKKADAGQKVILRAVRGTEIARHIKKRKIDSLIDVTWLPESDQN